LEATYEESKLRCPPEPPGRVRVVWKLPMRNPSSELQRLFSLGRIVWKLPMRNPSFSLPGGSLGTQTPVWKLPMRNPSFGAANNDKRE